MSQIKIVLEEDTVGNLYPQFACMDDFDDPADDEHYWEELFDRQPINDEEDLELSDEYFELKENNDV